MLPSAMRGGDAVCVETRNHPRLRAAVENVRALLPTAWHITILHGPQNAAHARRELASIADVRLRALPGAATTIGRGAAGAGGSSFGTAAANAEAAGKGLSERLRHTLTLTLTVT